MRSVVRIYPDPPRSAAARSVPDQDGAIAQLGERLLCKQEVGGSIPPGSTSIREQRSRGRVASTPLFSAGLPAEPLFKKMGNVVKALHERECVRALLGCCSYQRHVTPGCLGLYGQAIKRIRWMPWRQQAMKDVVACDKPRGAGKQALIRGFPNGETHPS